MNGNVFEVKWIQMRGQAMELIKFILSLTAGAVIGWFASRVVTTEHRWNHKPKTVKVSSSVKS